MFRLNSGDMFRLNSDSMLWEINGREERRNEEYLNYTRFWEVKDLVDQPIKNNNQRRNDTSNLQIYHGRWDMFLLKEYNIQMKYEENILKKMYFCSMRHFLHVILI